jgi:hypothetical protein
MKQEIGRVLHSYEDSWELSPKGQEQWFNAFASKVYFKNISLVEKISLFKKFYKTDLSECSFKELFKDKIERMPEFVSPLNYHKQLKENEIHKIAFGLSNLTNLDFNKSALLCSRLFRLYSIDQWTYETFMILLNDYDQKLKLELLLTERKAA